jgi:hypothetical protein
MVTGTVNGVSVERRRANPVCIPVNGYFLASIVEMYSMPSLSLLVVRMLNHWLRMGQRW